MSRRRRLWPEDASLNGVVLHTACRSSSRETLEISARMTATDRNLSPRRLSIRSGHAKIRSRNTDWTFSNAATRVFMSVERPSR